MEGAEPGISATVPASDAAPTEKRNYPAASTTLTQSGPLGIRFDFNEGARIVLPASDPPWHVRLRDLDTGNILFQSTLPGGFVNSAKRYYVRFGIEVSQAETPVLQHAFDAAGQEVLILFPVGTLGDTIGWMPYAERFRQAHGCRLTCGMAAPLIALFRDAYEAIEFLPHEAVTPERYYATYYLGLFFDDADHVWQPSDFRLVGLHRTAGYILGVDPVEEPPRLGLADPGRPIDQPYVVIATQSTTQAKYWNNPYGWRELVAFLNSAGYRVVCIDQRPVHGHGLVWNQIPHGAEDETGDRPLAERLTWLRHAAAFIGLSSGLSWLAWAAGTPVVLISGFTHPTNEFATPHRVINYHVCNSCWNDPRVRFKHDDFLWCPRHAGTSRQFECTRLITVEQVKQAVQRVPGLASIEAA